MRKCNLLSFVLMLFVFFLMAGETKGILAQTSPDTLAEKKKARISLDYFSINNTEHQLVATVKTRVEGRYENVDGITIHLYKDLVSPENHLIDIVTKKDGRAVYALPNVVDTSLVHTYIAALENDSAFEDAEKDATIQKAWMEMTAEEADSVKTIKVFVGIPDAKGNKQPAAGIPVGLFVKRLFGELPLQKDLEVTDEQGYLTMEIPSGIPGDKNGDYVLIAKVSDNELFGNLAATKTVSWGIPLAQNASAQLHELWLSSANTSEAILIITLILLFCIFGVVIYILRQLMQIAHMR